MINSQISNLINEDNNLIDVAENIKSIGFKAHFNTLKKNKTPKLNNHLLILVTNMVTI